MLMGLPILAAMRLLERRFSAVGHGREGELVVECARLEALRQSGGRGDDEIRPLSLDQAFAGQAAEHERHGFTGRADELAEQPITRRLRA